MMTNKQIEKWASKGAEWCAERLWKARNELSSRNHRDAKWLADEVIDNEESKSMKKVLDAGIITPQKLIVTYIWYGDPECSWCEESWADCETCEFHIPHEETRPMGERSATMVESNDAERQSFVWQMWLWHHV